MKVTKVHLILALIQPFPFWMVHWCFPPKLNVFLFHSILFFIPLSFSYSLFISLSTSHFCSTWGHFYVAWFLMIFRSFDQITTLTYFNLNLRSYGQHFVLVFLNKYKMLYILARRFFWVQSGQLRSRLSIIASRSLFKGFLPAPSELVNRLQLFIFFSSSNSGSL